jgi:hypothetical protein
VELNDDTLAVKAALAPLEILTDEGTVTRPLLLDKPMVSWLWVGAVRATEQLSDPAAV